MTAVADETGPKNSRSLAALIAQLPGQLMALVKAELDHLKKELVRKAVHAGIGIGFFAFAGVILFFLVPVLLAAAVLGLAVVFPGWLAALLVAAGMLILIGILVLLGIRWFKKAMPPAPSESIDSMKEDVEAIKGMGRYDR